MIKTSKRAKQTSVKPEAVKAEAVKTEAARPQPVKSQAPRFEAAKPEAAKPQPIKTVTPTPERVKAAPVKTDTAKAEVTKAAPPRTGHVSLELVKPDAKTVCVAGSFNEWKPERTPLAPLGNGHWAGDLLVKPGRHEYLFVVDGQWLPDPNAKETVQNPFGGKNSVLVVSE
jgi:hypothetical protein